MKKELSIYDEGMKYFQNEEEPCKIVHDFLKDVLDEEYVVKFRLIDPRTRPFDCYGKITKDVKDRIKILYSSYKVLDKNTIWFTPGDHVIITLIDVEEGDLKTKIEQDDFKYKYMVESRKGVMF